MRYLLTESRYDIDINDVRNQYLTFSGSPGRLTVRFLTTIPSAAENSMQMEDDQPSAILVSPSKEHEGPLYAILHTAPVAPPARRQSIVTLHPTETMNGFSTNLSSQNSNSTAEPGTSS